jgi:hypothetical protein
MFGLPLEHSAGCLIWKEKETANLKVNIEREVDIDRLLINLNERSLCKDPGMAGYEVIVNKQLLRDAHDVIAQFVKQRKNVLDLGNGMHLHT